MHGEKRGCGNTCRHHVPDPFCEFEKHLGRARDLVLDVDVGGIVVETEGRLHVPERLAPKCAGPVKVLAEEPGVGICKVVPDEQGSWEERGGEEDVVVEGGGVPAVGSCGQDGG